MANEMDNKLHALARQVFTLSTISQHMPVSTVRILLTVALHASEEPDAPGLTIEEISRRTGAEATLVSRWVKALSTPDDAVPEAGGTFGKGLSERGLLAKALGRRGSVSVTLTPKGRTIIERIVNGGAL